MSTLLSSARMNIIPGAPLVDVSSVALRAPSKTSTSATRPDPEVAATAKRRQYSSAEKRRILAEADPPRFLGRLPSLG